MLVAILMFLASATIVDFAGYWLHRWAHRPGSPLYRAHMTHHVVNYPPRKVFSDRYRSSGSDSLALWLAPFGLAYLIVLFLVDPPYVWVWVAGGAASAVASAVVHDLTHVSRSVVWMWRWTLGMAVRHHTHHFKMGRNFGILSPVWDVLFGTRRPLSKPRSRQGRP